MSKCGSEITCSKCCKFLGNVEFTGFYDFKKDNINTERFERKNHVYIVPESESIKKPYCNECASKILGNEI